MNRTGTAADEKRPAASGERSMRGEKELTLQEFKTKVENDEELKLALKEALEKDDETVEAFLKAQGVEISDREPLSDDEVEAVAGGAGRIRKKIKNYFQTVLGINEEGKEAWKEIIGYVKDGAEIVKDGLHDVFYK